MHKHSWNLWAFVTSGLPCPHSLVLMSIYQCQQVWSQVQGLAGL